MYELSDIVIDDKTPKYYLTYSYNNTFANHSPATVYGFDKQKNRRCSPNDTYHQYAKNKKEDNLEIIKS